MHAILLGRLSAVALLAFGGLRLTDIFAAGPGRSTLNDSEVLGIYIQVNGFDVETALLGRAQATSPKVRSLASRVATDHLGVRQAAYDLASACKVTPTLPNERIAAAIEHTRTMARLAKLGGSEFDRAYVQHELAFHRAAVDAIRQTLLPSAACPALKTHFATVLPAFEHHIAETERTAHELTAP
jgi:putative membrane protein